MKTGFRIGIFGSYNASSEGDLAILKGILVQLREAFPLAGLEVFSFAPGFIRQRLSLFAPGVSFQVVPARPGIASEGKPSESGGAQPPAPASKRTLWRALLGQWSVFHDAFFLFRHWRFWFRQWRRVRSLDALLIGGGGLLVDLYPKWPILPLLYVLLAKLARRPVMFYAVGVGPIATMRGKIYFSLALNLSNGVTVRDRFSLAEAKRLLLDKTKVERSADPAFALAGTFPSSQRAPLSGDKPAIGISTVSLFRPGDWPVGDSQAYETYVQRMARLVVHLLQQFSGRVFLFSTNCPKDVRTAEDILKAVRSEGKEDQVTVFPHCSLTRLSPLLASLDVVVGTRLHSLIFAVLHQTPLVALAYQEKVVSFCEELGLPELSFPVEAFYQEDEEAFERVLERILKSVGDLLRHREDNRVYLAARAQVFQQAAEKNVKMLSRLLDVLMSEQSRR